MKVIINTIAFITFLMQSIVFSFGALNQKEPKCTEELLYNYFVVLAFLCSLLTIVIFVVQYNLKNRMFEKKWINCILLIITILGIYINLYQLFVLTDFIITSFIMLLFDVYIIRNIINRLWLTAPPNRTDQGDRFRDHFSSE
jgi:amino acid transporter